MILLQIILAAALPCLAVAVGALGLFSDNPPGWWHGTGFWIYIAAWLTCVLATAVAVRKRGIATGGTRAVFLGYLWLAYIPALLGGIWLFSAPYLHLGSLQIFAACCLLPLAFCMLWYLVLQPYAVEASRIELVLPGISAIAAIVVLGTAYEWLFAEDLFTDKSAENSPDRSYWYISSWLRPDGTNAANSFGYLGPEPAQESDMTRILVIGDSIPAAGRPVEFVGIAERLYEQTTEQEIEILNASVASFSLEQIRNFYTERLKGLSHDILIVSFYLDDVNRELRYRKNSHLYTPSWPEWMQDVYHSCVLCRKLLELRSFTENTFLFYRTRTYAEAFPGALDMLSEIHDITQARGVRLAVMNVPRFTWSSILADPASYQYAQFHQEVEQWCRDRSIPYLDLLPVLAQQDIREFRISDTDIHFNDAGHHLVGQALMQFVVSSFCC